MVQHEQPASMDIDEEEVKLCCRSRLENKLSTCFKERRRWDNNVHCRVSYNYTLARSKNRQKLNKALQREIEGDSKYEIIDVLLKQGADPNHWFEGEIDGL